MQKKILRVGLSLYLEFRIPIIVKVKAYTRIRNGKIEKVRSHYRSVWGRQMVIDGYCR